jgi:hypothetical protein
MENEHKFSDEDPTLVDAKAIEIELDDTDTGKEEKGYARPLVQVPGADSRG